ncbi:MAG TPA: NAD(P)/FAD-dependent oxidoreductase [Paenibacillus sp.]|uniref:NAD(P)-binding domain-containing protein n=1 Tax=Paenibacillus TaxID=44249 RepID=UPI000B9FA6F4|nr:MULTISPECIES: NAD(P)-binding domain-containing protein [Paenibacillus]OZQ60428.1 glutamate synthase [Paenibacillus taichungensis]HBU82425.1 NAD(P)/FAD-dependent oxidoreductase [Paenibacillus sp.]
MKNIEFKQVESCCAPTLTEKQASLQEPVHQGELSHLPVAIIGAGPIGLAAAAHLIEAGQSFIILEAGSKVGENISKWGHVRLFSPWQYNVDKAAERLLTKNGWIAPSPDELPTGHELRDLYLLPLAKLPKIQTDLHLNTRVVGISRKNTDKMKTIGREKQPFVIYVEEEGKNKQYEARAVIDASGTWEHANPVLSSGVLTPGEKALHDRIFYGIPDVLGETRERYTNKHVAVVGGGHSALNTLLDLSSLQEMNSGTKLTWLMRRDQVEEAYGGEANDQLEARGELGSRIHKLVDSGKVNVITPFHIQELKQEGHQVTIIGEQRGVVQEITQVDEIIVNAGSRPDFSFLRELRLSIDQITESVETLAPLIDPNVHSCGTVRPHGEKELRHMEQGFYIVGMKSYGRAPTFLMATGYEQVRSVVAFLVGDLEAALKVELDLPETGVCSVNRQQVKVVAEEKGDCSPSCTN